MRIIFFLLSILPNIIFAQPYVVGRLQGQLGNQLFIVAATTSLALEHNAQALFPDFELEPNQKGRKVNHQRIFTKLNTSMPPYRPRFVYQEPSFSYHPIPYKPDMEIRGYFQSEKYFKKYEKQIRELFAPSQKITEYLEEKYKDLLDHPRTVAIHLRSYVKDVRPTVLPTLLVRYYQKAMSQFSSNSRFIVFSNDRSHARKVMSFCKGEIIFIDSQDYIYDFYLMSMCKHQIISNSSFAWWSAYLNTNPEKIVIAPGTWFGPDMQYKLEDLLPETWEVIDF